MDIVYHMHDSMGFAPLCTYAGQLIEFVYGIENTVLVSAVEIFQVLVDDLSQRAPCKGFLQFPAYENTFLQN